MNQRRMIKEENIDKLNSFTLIKSFSDFNHYVLAPLWIKTQEILDIHQFFDH